MIRLIPLENQTTPDDKLVYALRNEDEDIGFLWAAPKYAKAIETAVMIVQRTPLALGEK